MCVIPFFLSASLCVHSHCSSSISSFFFNDTATTEIYTLSLHDALPISTAAAPVGTRRPRRGCPRREMCSQAREGAARWRADRKSTRLNSSHLGISYAVFCLKKKKKKINIV